MPIYEKRKVQKVGGSFMISLPQNWIRGALKDAGEDPDKLEDKKEEILVEVLGNGKLTIELLTDKKKRELEEKNVVLVEGE